MNDSASVVAVRDDPETVVVEPVSLAFNVTIGPPNRFGAVSVRAQSVIFELPSTPYRPVRFYETGNGASSDRTV